MTLIRLTGALLAFCAVSAVGFYMAGAAKYRLKELAAFKASLIILKSEINYGLTALETAALTCARRGQGGAARFFLRLSEKLREEGYTADEAWQAALPSLKPALDNDDLTAIAHIGKALGKLDKDAQTAAIDMAIEYIGGKTALLTAKAAKDGRLFQTVGVIGGLMAAIVLI